MVLSERIWEGQLGLDFKRTRESQQGEFGLSWATHGGVGVRWLSGLPIARFDSAVGPKGLPSSGLETIGEWDSILPQVEYLALVSL